MVNWTTLQQEIEGNSNSYLLYKERVSSSVKPSLLKEHHDSAHKREVTLQTWLQKNLARDEVRCDDVCIQLLALSTT